MFTGIIEDIGTVKSVEKTGDSGRICVESSIDTKSISIGESISIDGVCLSVTEKGTSYFTADVSAETLGLTTLGSLSSGTRVNLERALKLGDRLGGHIVTGHVDTLGTISSIDASGRGGATLEVDIRDKDVIKYIVKKGSVAVDGASLTIASLHDAGFGVAIVPHTLSHTNLRFKGVSARVNIETDIIGKYLESFTGAYEGVSTTKGGRVTEGFLREHGFIKGSKE